MPESASGGTEAYERFKRELHDEFRLIRKGHRAPQVRIGGLTPAETEVVMALAHGIRHGIEARPGRIARFIDSTPPAPSRRRSGRSSARATWRAGAWGRTRAAWSSI